MTNYTGIDGLVLCAIDGKIDAEQWISSIDMLNHSIITREELNNSVNNLLSGELIQKVKNKFVLSKQAKKILRGGFWKGCIEWQLTVQKRIQLYSYDETKTQTFNLAQEDYDAALKKYQDGMDKMVSRLIK